MSKNINKIVVNGADLGKNVAAKSFTFTLPFNHALVDDVVVVPKGAVKQVIAAWMFKRIRADWFSPVSIQVQYTDANGKPATSCVPNATSYIIADDGVVFYNSNGNMINAAGNVVKKRTAINTFSVAKHYEGYVQGRTLYISQAGLDSCLASKAGQVRCWVSPSSSLTFTLK